MRPSRTLIIASLAAALAWLGGLVLPAAAGAPDVCGVVQNLAAGCREQLTGQEQGEESEGICGLFRSCDECGPRWSLESEARVLQRSAPRRQQLFINPQSLTTDPLSASSLNFPMTIGYQVGAIRHDVCGCDWEVSYFQLDGFAIDTVVPGVSSMVLDVNETVSLVNNAFVRYSSAIYSGEVNMRREWSDGFTVIAGFRTGQLNEHYTGGGARFSALEGYDYLTTNTYNHLYGFQLGADINVYDMGGPLRINLLCKGGIYDNYARFNFDRYATSNQGVVNNDAGEVGRSQAAFLGEANLVLTYAVTKRLAFRASAETMWLTGMALAPEQISAINLRTNRHTINTSGAVFYYGGGMGAEYRF
jgi:hypothetical protein